MKKKDIEIKLPYKWDARDYQVPFLRARQNGCKRMMRYWHRRAGKDLTDVHMTVRETQARVGVYWHIFPFQAQGRKALWDGITGGGERFINAFPGATNPKATESLVAKTNQQEMKITLKNGSIWQVVGADNVDSLVGTNPCGIVFSEYPLISPKVWQFLEPILVENGGWASFNGTPRGRNHAHKLLESVKDDPDWFTEILSIKDTGVISEEQIEKLRNEGLAEEIIQQEYYCSFESGNVGAYYADLVKKSQENGHFVKNLHSKAHQVQTYWDLGIDDATAIWFVQFVGREIWLIDYFEDNNKGPDYYAKILREKEAKLGYNYGVHNLPWDADQRQFTSGARTSEDQMKELGIRPTKVHRKTNSVQADIDQTRLIFNKCIFDIDRTGGGVECLKSYTKKWDEKKNTYLSTPLHDWASHGADAFRLLGKSYFIDRPWEKDHTSVVRTKTTFDDLMEPLVIVDNEDFERI